MKYITLFLLLALAACNSSQLPPVPPDVPPSGDVPALKYQTGYIKDLKHYGKPYWRPKHIYKAIAEDTLPDDFSWIEQGYNVKILDQDQCGSCWAFATTTTAMWAAKIYLGQDLVLSPQEIVAYDSDNYGCSGGNYAGKFVKKYGLVLEKDCPYTASNRKCQPDPRKKTPAFKADDYVYIGAPDREPTYDEVIAFIHQYGAVGVSFGADGALNGYHGGVISNCRGTDVNHEVAAYGWNRKTKSLKIRNSWGTSFGVNGDFEMAWGCNHMAYDAGAVIVKHTPSDPPKVEGIASEYTSLTAGKAVTLATEPVEGVSYEWFQGTTSLSKKFYVTVKPVLSTEYRLVAKNTGGEAEIQTLVTVKD